MAKTKVSEVFKRFTENEKSGGFVLILCTAISLLLTNYFIGEDYHNFWGKELISGGGSVEIWINDGLMALFFLLVGLELKRELYIGELSHLKEAMLPIFGALGGMLIPAGIYLLFNFGTSTQHGYGIPMATDIAFALGALSLLGKRVPLSLRIFLTALATIDDLGAILVIAVFYSSAVFWTNLFIALGIFVLLIILNKAGVRNLLIYLVAGGFMWYFMLHSGVHATIAGVLLALAIPLKGKKESDKSPLGIVEKTISKPVTFIILPLFALANTALFIHGDITTLLTRHYSLGILFGLVLGKPIGIFLFAYLSCKIGLCRIPKDINWRILFGVAILGGIGFTMSIFVTLLAFDSQTIINDAKLVILISSLLAGALGYFFLKGALKKQKEEMKTEG